MLIDIAHRSADVFPAEQDFPFPSFSSTFRDDLYPTSRVWEYTTQEVIIGIDYTVLLLTLSGILSTLRRPHHLAFLKLHCELADFLFHHEQLRRNAVHLARIRVQRAQLLDRRFRFWLARKD